MSEHSYSGLRSNATPSQSDFHRRLQAAERESFAQPEYPTIVELLADAEDARDCAEFGEAWDSLKEAERLIDLGPVGRAEEAKRINREAGAFGTMTVVSITLILLVAALLQWALGTFGAVSKVLS